MFLFFSSRRRHTRLQGDWSSDVCSSDLYGPPGPLDTKPGIGSTGGPELGIGVEAPRVLMPPPPQKSGPVRVADRSEERRVGKERRAGGQQPRQDRANPRAQESKQTTPTS